METAVTPADMVVVEESSCDPHTVPQKVGGAEAKSLPGKLVPIAAKSSGNRGAAAQQYTRCRLTNPRLFTYPLQWNLVEAVKILQHSMEDNHYKETGTGALPPATSHYGCGAL